MICLLLLCSGLGAQDHPLHQGRFRSQPDSLRLQALFQRVFELYKEHPDSALETSRQAYELARTSIVGGDHPDLATAISNLGFFLDNAGDRKGARPLYTESLAMNRRLYDGDHPALAQAMNNMGYFLNGAGELATAETLFVAAQEMKTRLYAGDHSELAIGLNNLAVFFDEQGRSAPARVYYDSALAMTRRIHDGDAAELASMIGNVGYFHVTQGRLREGESFYLEALAIYERLYAHEHESIVTMRNNLAYLYELQGRIREAEERYVSVVESARRLYPDDHPVKATAINNLGSYYLGRGMDAEAEPLYIEALEMRRRLNPEGNVDLLVSINNMGYFHTRRGRYREAEEMFAEAGRVLDRIAPGDHPYRALHLNNRASLLAEQGQHAAAETLYTTSLEMKERLYEQPHKEIALACNNIGTAQREQRRLADAAAMFTRAIDIFRQLEESVDYEIAVSLGNLGRVEIDLGKTDEGIRHLEESDELRRDLFPDGHVDRIVSERNLAKANILLGNTQEARKHLDELLLQLDAALRLSFGFDSEAHQLAFMNNVLKPNLNLITLYCLRNAESDPSAPALMLQSLLRFKGAIANESARRSAEWSKDRYTISLREQLTGLREQDAQLSSRPQDDVLRAERLRIQRRADSLDAALRKLDREYEKLRSRQEADWRDIQRQLKSDEALVEFAAVPVSENNGSGGDTLQYAAVILRRSGAPVIVRLADEARLATYVSEAIDPRVPSYVTQRDVAEQLSGLVWEPLERFLDGVNAVWLIPDGLLHRLSFHALLTRDASGGFVHLDDRYELHLLTGARDLLSRNVRYRPQPYRRPDDAVLFGAPQFSDGASDGTTSGERSQTAADTRGGSWGPLPGTRTEVEEVDRLCRERSVPSIVHTGADATEERIKELSGQSPRILHVATHGFFFPVLRVRLQDLPFSLRSRGGAVQLRTEDNPMLRSGLVLSGANVAWTGASPAPRQDDGILSALEISRLDFSGTDLVALSACETGLGDITNGEGIFGLQRAFQVAGASRLLMTLWKVADEATVVLMKHFYDRYLAGMDADKAFREARKAMRAVYPNPWYWAGFVLIEQ
ncbi:MAG: CHAT domain-containing protein [Bacteroidetes bacterium]|nr:CHAT domain-containing protein [Bacteroidota bacterium]